MGYLHIGPRAARLLAIVALLASTLLALGAAPLPAHAAAPFARSTGSPGQATLVPDHRAEARDFASKRQVLDGRTPLQAQQDAVRQARALPTAPALPAAVGGKRPTGGQPASLLPPTGSWRPLGPAPLDGNDGNPASFCCRNGIVGGRTTALAVGTHTGVIYLGGEGGGVWKSTDDGTSWTPLTDNQSSMVIGALALDPADPTDRTLYVGTGETNNVSVATGDYFFASYGAGILRTADGGATWTTLGASTFLSGASGKAITALVVNGTTLWAATTGGLFTSATGGASWSSAALPGVPATARVETVVADPTDNTTLYALVAGNVAGNTFSGAYKSTHGGPFALLSSPNLPAATSWGRSALAIAPANHQTLYLVITTLDDSSAGSTLIGIYKTTDGGATWLATAAPPFDFFNSDGAGGQGWFDIVIAADPGDATGGTVYAGGIDYVRSTDGGATWAAITNVYCRDASGVTHLPCASPIHPDQHALAFAASGSPRPFYAGDDGGIFKTTDRGASWTERNGNLNTITFFAGDTVANYIADPEVAAGAIDHGSSLTTSASAGMWGEIFGGDGGFTAVDKTNPDHVFAERPFGSLAVTTDVTAGAATTWTYTYPTAGTGCDTSVGELFVNPFVLDPNHPNHLLYASFGQVCETVNGGQSWFTENVAAGAAVTALAIAPSNGAVLYTGQTGAVYRATNGDGTGAATFSACGSGLPAAPISSLAVDATDANTAYATFFDYGVAHVWRSVNCGVWQSIAGNLPDAPTASLATYPIAGGAALIVATDVGAFLSTNGGTSWSALATGLPNTILNQLFMDNAHTTLLVATYGRGVWAIGIPASTDPTITAVNPTSGPTTGGSRVTITGTNFQAGATVTLGGAAATNVTVSATHITVTTPAHAVGAVDVVVLNPDGRGVRLVQGYIYAVLNPLPSPQPSGGPSGNPNPLPPARPSGGNQGVPNPLPSPRP